MKWRELSIVITQGQFSPPCAHFLSKITKFELWLRPINHVLLRIKNLEGGSD